MQPLPWPGDRLPGLALIALVAGGAVATALADGAFEPLDLPVLDGEWAAAWEDRLDHGFAPRQWGVVAWGVVEFLAFGDGRPGVVIGEDGWLFTGEELEWHPDRDAEVRRKVDRIVEVDRALAERDIALVVALVPSKARIYSDKLDLPASVAPVYADALAALVDAGVAAPDLEAALRDGRGQRAVFCQADTHWTPWGAHLAAVAVASAVPGWERRPGVTWSTKADGELEVVGDLLAYVPLGPWQGRIGPGPERVERRRLVGTGGQGGGLFGDVEIPVAVVGTSYTAEARWGFADELKAALGADVLIAASEGTGPFEPMRAYLADEAFMSSPPELVVWEIPERYLAKPGAR